MEYPGVGVGVYIRKDNKILLGKRKGGHGAGEWCPPGGKMEMNESPERCAVRETKEETGLEIRNLRFAAITNDIWSDIGTHYITISFVADWESGEAHLTEPDKFETWEWFSWNSLPESLFLSTRNFIQAGHDPFVL